MKHPVSNHPMISIFSTKSTRDVTTSQQSSNDHTFYNKINQGCHTQSAIIQWTHFLQQNQPGMSHPVSNHPMISLLKTKSTRDVTPSQQSSNDLTFYNKIKEGCHTQSAIVQWSHFLQQNQPGMTHPVSNHPMISLFTTKSTRDVTPSQQSSNDLTSYNKINQGCHTQSAIIQWSHFLQQSQPGMSPQASNHPIISLFTTKSTRDVTTSQQSSNDLTLYNKINQGCHHKPATIQLSHFSQQNKPGMTP